MKRTLCIWIARVLLFVVYYIALTMVLGAEPPTSGFIFTNRCSSTETERAEQMLVVGNQLTVIVHDKDLWEQAKRLIDQDCELGLLPAR